MNGCDCDKSAVGPPALIQEFKTRGGDRMRKLSFVGMMLLVGVSFALASSISVPWFSDNAPQFNGVPGKASGVTALVSLKSNVDSEVTCYITYYNADGIKLGPFAPNNSFTIAPRSALSFRPVMDDPGPGVTVPGHPAGAAGGQEGAQGVKVPNRPLDQDTKKNGSITIEWFGAGAQAIQGMYSQFQTVVDPAGSGDPGKTVTMSFGHLLPPGI